MKPNNPDPLYGQRVALGIAVGGALPASTPVTSIGGVPLDPTSPPPAPGSILVVNPDGGLAWAPGMAVGGDLSGSLPNPTVAYVNGLAVNPPTSTLLLTYAAGLLTQLQRFDGPGNLVETITLAYTGTQVSTMTITKPGSVLTLSMSYDGSGNLTAISRGVITTATAVQVGGLWPVGDAQQDRDLTERWYDPWIYAEAYGAPVANPLATVPWVPPTDGAQLRAPESPYDPALDAPSGPGNW